MSTKSEIISRVNLHSNAEKYSIRETLNDVLITSQMRKSHDLLTSNTRDRESQILRPRAHLLALTMSLPPALCCSRSRFPRQCRVFTCNNLGSCNVPTKAFPAWIPKYANVSVALDVSPRLRASLESSCCSGFPLSLFLAPHHATRICLRYLR